MKKLLIVMILSTLLIGCGKHIIKHNIPEANIKFNERYIIAVETFKDMRPEEECTGKTDEFLKFASKDKHFKKVITQHLKDTFIEEFSKVGLLPCNYEDNDKSCYDYILSGKVIHYQAALKLPKTTVIPYLKTITSLWTKDEFIIAIEIDVKLTQAKTGKILLDKTYTFAEDKKLPTGLFSLARYSRGFNYKLKLLDEALGNVIEEIRNDVLEKIKDAKDK